MWSVSVENEFKNFMLGEKIGEGMTRCVYEHPFDPLKVIKVENSAKYFQNVIEWEFWNEWKNDKDVSRWLAPCHFISDSGTFLIMDKAENLPKNKTIKKLPSFITDVKRDNLGLIRNKVVCRDYGFVKTQINLKLKKVFL